MKQLSIWQRIRRRIALLGGSYTHPDGYIELDFEAAAGVDRRDSEELQDAKLQRHWAKEARFARLGGAAMVGLGVYLLTRSHPGAWDVLGGIACAAMGVREVTR